MKNFKNLFCLFVIFGFISLSVVVYAQQKANINKKLPTNNLMLAPGFQLKVFADNVPYARQMALGDKGTVFVGSRKYDRVHALVDKNKDGVADQLYEIGEGLNSPNGVAFKNGSLYVAEIHRVIRYDHIEDNLKEPPEPVVVNDSFSEEAWHGWKYIKFGPDDKLYIPVGAPCNVCEKDDERFGTIMRMNPDGTELQIYAKGVRNSVGFDWDPRTGHLWFTDNGRDMLGDDLPPDEFNYAPEEGMHFGFPYCHGKNVLDPELGVEGDCEKYSPPAYELDAHVASLGMIFYRGDMFPEGYKKHVLIAEHGSWNSSVKVGYRISAVRVEPNNEANFYGTMIYGWLKNDKVWGRPVDLLELEDGSVLISDDYASAVYRVFF